MLDKILSALGVLTIVAAVVSVFIVSGMGWWGALGGIFAGYILINIKGDEADSLIFKVIDKFVDKTKTKA